MKLLQKMLDKSFPIYHNKSIKNEVREMTITNFQDIPKYTEDGHYRADVPIEHLEMTIQRWLESVNLDINPDFQRGHVWDKDKQIAFVEHLLKGGQGSKEIRFNCPNWQRRNIGRMVLVDGLQRLTAVRLFMSDKLPAFGSTLSQFDGFLPYTFTLSFRVNDLETRAEVLQWYLEINTGGVVHTPEEIERVRKLLDAERNNGNA